MAPSSNRTRLALAAVAALAIVVVAAASSGCKPVVATTAPAVTLRTALDRTAVLAGSEGLVRAELVLGGREATGAARAVPTDLVVVFDRSGSMSGRKIEDAKNAVRELLGQLSEEDRFALVSYASDARVDVPLARVTPSTRAAWLSIVSALQATTGTNMSSGLDVGIEQVGGSRQSGRVARVVLVSDGLANEGDPTPEGLARRARSVAAKEHVLSTVGVGLDFDEHMMTSLADAGTGNFYFVEEASNLAGVFAAEFGAARETVASAATVTVRPADGVQLVEAAGYPLEWKDGAATFRPGALFAGQERRVWLTFRAPTSSTGAKDLARVSVSYVADGAPARIAAVTLPQVTCVADEAKAIAAIDRPEWERGVVSEEYTALQQEVSKDVKAGRKEAAIAKVQTYWRVNATLNATVQSGMVAKNLDDAKKLEAEVNDAFTGADQALKQNRMSKSSWSSGQDGRRAGAKK